MEYPESLIELVAAGIYESKSTLEPDYVPSKWPPKHPDDAQAMRDYAVGAMDALVLLDVAFQVVPRVQAWGNK